jgi:hypothetical protein
MQNAHSDYGSQGTIPAPGRHRKKKSDAIVIVFLLIVLALFVLSRTQRFGCAWPRSAPGVASDPVTCAASWELCRTACVALAALIS